MSKTGKAPLSFAASFDTFPRNLALVLVFNTLIALGLAAADHGQVFQSFVRSQCIGLSVLLAIDLPSRLLWRKGRPLPRKAFVLLCAVGMVLGFLLGNWVAGRLLGGAAANLPWAGREQRAALGVTLLASASATFYFWNRGRLARLRLQAETLERQATEARLRLLQAQIEPHFLFNTLANLHSLIGIDAARAQHMLEHLNDYLRASLQAARKPEATLGDEFALIARYLELLSVRMGERLSWSLALPRSLEAEPLPPMLLQPLVENAIKHGLEPKVEGGRIEVSAQVRGERLSLLVRDSGLGLGRHDTAGTGLGVQHVRERLAASYGASAWLRLENQHPAGVLASIELPMRRPLTT
jgi:hypothetical protein